MTKQNLTTMTPAEVDTILVDAMEKAVKHSTIIGSQTERAEAFESQAENFAKTLEYPTLSDSDRKYWEGRVAKYKEDAVKARGFIEESKPLLKVALEAKQACEAEFSRRGGWSRFWIVVNSNGHIHSSMNCTTCFPTTAYAWLPSVSGSTDAEVIELAGEKACTICFPDAPVDTRNRPSKLEEPAKKAAREEREAAKAEREAKKAAKAIANPDGSVVKLSGKFGNKVYTESEAQRIFVDNLVSLILDEDDLRYRIPNREYVEEKKADNKILLTALAHKRNLDAEVVSEELTKKARVKIKRDWK
jgi:hypothetical protein